MTRVNAKEAAWLACYVYGALQKSDELEKLYEYLLRRPHSVILEIGTCHGGMLWWLSHLPNFKRIISVDLPGSAFGGGPTAHDRDVIKAWADPEFDVVLCTGDSQKEETFKEVSNEFGSERVDLLFIDADHTYEGVKRDFELWSPLVRNGGTIVFHDVVDHSKSNPACRVKDFWDEIRASRPMGIFFEIISADPIASEASKGAPHGATWGGLGVMEV